MLRSALLVLIAVAAGAVETITINASLDRHAINPLIYGVAFASTVQLTALNAPSNRWGGNTTSRYNWKQNADNKGSDWYFESLDSGEGSGQSAAANVFIDATRAAGAQPMLTVPTIGWAAKLGNARGRLSSFSIAKYGPQTGSDWQWMPDAGNGVLSTGNITGNDPNDANVPVDSTFQREWITYLKGKYGSASAGGLRYYLLDNEPGLWHETHRDIHPVGASMDELWTRLSTHAAAIKSADPGAMVVGPEEWGYLGLTFSGLDAQNGRWVGGPGSDRAAHGNLDCLPWLLQQFQQYQNANGVRLLDVCTTHCYPTGNEFSNDVSATTQALRNRSTRALWDPTYMDEAWVGTQIRMIPRLKQWVATYYPGTQVGITEYNWGAENHINGATAQADILGIFGREGLDMAARWTTPDASTPTFKAMQLYRNYDGANAGFGDTSLRATVANPDNLSSFAAVRASDGALTVMLINKSAAVTACAVNLSSFNAAAASQVWQLTAANSITRIADIAVAANQANLTVPAQSITLLVLAAAVNLAPTVTVSAPATATVGSAIALSAIAADSDGSIASIEFSIGSTLLATDSSSPYAASWTPSVAGSYAVTAKATDNLGATTVSASQTVVVSFASTGPGTGTGLTATYFSGMTLANSVVTKTDTTVDFDWGNGAPVGGVGADGFSVRWTGQVQAQFSETYTFTTLSDDGVRLWVNGQQLVSNWTDHGPTENSGTIALVAGQKYDLKLEYFENSGGAVAKLSWASPSTAKQIIPMTQLYPSTPGALPAGWSAQDIGSVSAAGSTTQDSGTWTVTGSGADIWGTADGCRFVSQRLTGDIQVTAQVSGLTNTNVWAKAGVMIRESLTAGSRHASTFATAANGLAYQRRLVTDGVSSHTAGPASATPYWVRIERLGNVVISSTSPNGTTWTEIRRETIAMSAAVYVGLAVTSHNNGVLCTATFTNVQVVGIAAAAN